MYCLKLPHSYNVCLSIEIFNKRTIILGVYKFEVFWAVEIHIVAYSSGC
jgi:hypothetical protein